MRYDRPYIIKSQMSRSDSLLQTSYSREIGLIPAEPWHALDSHIGHPTLQPRQVEGLEPSFSRYPQALPKQNKKGKNKDKNVADTPRAKYA